jgi:2-oxoglutarate ferredoxin oxidoreductase subunit alpha
MSAVLPLARLMQGNEAIAEGALAAGARFFAGYPITPFYSAFRRLPDRL